MLPDAVRLALRRLFEPPDRAMPLERELPRAAPLVADRAVAAAPSAEPAASWIEPGDESLALGTEAQLALLRDLAPIARAFDWPHQRVPERRFWARNGQFEHGDAALLYAMLRRLRPRRVLALGVGFPAALMLDVRARDLADRTRLTFVEPRRERVDAVLRAEDRAAVRVLATPVAQVPLAEYDALEAGDVLFVDAPGLFGPAAEVSYHVLFRALPRLRAGVVVHLPDVFWPFAYPGEWVRAGRASHELHLVHAFLQYNAAWEILLFGSQLVAVCGDVATRLVPQLAIRAGGSLWLRRAARR